jgi:hypothetical protein
MPVRFFYEMSRLHSFLVPLDMTETVDKKGVGLRGEAPQPHTPARHTPSFRAKRSEVEESQNKRKKYHY